MPLKLNISDKEGKAWRLEIDAPGLAGKSVGEKVSGDLINPDFAGYELEITGGSDRSGLPLSKDVEGIGLKRVLLTKGWGMHKRPKGDKKKVPQPKGLRLRKSVRGKTIAETTIQVNMKVVKFGKKKLGEIFADQKKALEPEKPAEKAVPVEAPKEEVKEEPKPEEPKIEEKVPEEKPEEKPAEEPKAEEKKDEQ